MRTLVLGAAAFALLATLVPRRADAQTAEFTSLRIMRDKGIITQAEYDAAMSDLATSNGGHGADSTSLVVGKWSTTLYGFLESDFIHDTTESFNDQAGNALVARPSGHPLPAPAVPVTYTGANGATMFSIRNSRFGLRFRAPETHQVRVSGLLETDFLGTSLPIGTGNAYNGTEQAFFTSPTLRIRHAMIRVETPVVDVLVGQYWDLFGWQGFYNPNTVEIQGVPSQLYSRDIQLRVSKTLKTDAVTFEIAAAALRPPSRDSQVPELQGGLRFAVNKWTGTMTAGATGTSTMPASIAVTGDQRHFSLPEFSQIPVQSVSKDTQSIAVDAFIPIIPARNETAGNALSFTGELVYGNGISNLYSGLNGGIGFPTIANSLAINPAPTYPQNIDNGMVVYDLQGNLHAVQWTTWIVGLQYYLPWVQGRAWLSANCSRQVSSNIQEFMAAPGSVPNPQQGTYVPAEQVRKSEDWFDVNLFGQFTPSFRAGVEYANFNDFYVDATHAVNHRVQASGFFIF